MQKVWFAKEKYNVRCKKYDLWKKNAMFDEKSMICEKLAPLYLELFQDSLQKQWKMVAMYVAYPEEPLFSS